jgi:electron-transferring-flavoprotein dehydrogenase
MDGAGRSREIPSGGEMSDEREVLEVDILFVGAGAGSLAGALHLQNLINAHNENGGGPTLEPMLAIIEKGKEVGAHSLSGAVLDPIALRELVPDYREQGCPIEREVDSEDVYFLTRNKALRFPVTPPQLRNHGNYIISLSKFNRWLGGLVEAAGVNIFPGFAGVEIIEDNDAVAGIRTGDKGIDKNGGRKPNFEPGIDLRAKATVFADGPRGYLSKQLIEKRALQSGKPIQVYETGVKEIIELPDGRVDRGRVVHTMGYPFSKDAVGGTWIYYMGDNMVSIGLAVPLDYRDPFTHPHDQLQRFKEHPAIHKIIEGGKSVAYGAKVISAGGYYSIPKLYTNGALIVGEAGAMVDMSRLKGIHLAMKSGMLAAETIFQSLLSDDYSESALSSYEIALHESYVGKQMLKSRHFHKAMSKGLPRAFFHLGIQQLTGGADILSHDSKTEDRDTYASVSDYHGAGAEPPKPPQTNDSLFLDKLANVYNSGTMHDEDQPNHLKVLDTQVCYETCVDTYMYPCNRFCPANVYEMIKSEEDGSLQLQVSFANCVHCQTCDIKCPMDNIRWTPPEGGDGPNYQLL